MDKRYSQTTFTLEVFIMVVRYWEGDTRMSDEKENAAF